MAAPTLLALVFAIGAAHPFDAAERTDPLQSQPDSIGCLDTLRASDSLAAVVKLVVRPQDRKAQLPPDFEEFFAQEFKARFKVPTSLPLSVMLGTGTCDSTGSTCTGGGLWLSSTAYAVARRNGALSRIGVVDESLTPELAKSVMAVLDGMTSDRVVPDIRADSLRLEIGIRAESHPDTVAPSRRLFRVRLPKYDLTFIHPKAPLKFRVGYPRNAERAGVEDSVTVSFTIMANGSVNPRSFDLHSGRYRDFLRVVVSTLEKATYQPARIGACPVATWTSQSFVFKVPR
jgi:TonB family protein